MDLSRFTDAQASSYDQALEEIRSGRKRSHWMWYIFPQIKGLGHSSMAQHYAITSREEARSFLQHPVLGPRLIEISRALLALPSNNATAVMGTPDDLKLRSSMTLFAEVAGNEQVFKEVLLKYFQGRKDDRTLQLLQ